MFLKVRGPELYRLEFPKVFDFFKTIFSESVKDLE